MLFTEINRKHKKAYFWLRMLQNKPRGLIEKAFFKTIRCFVWICIFNISIIYAEQTDSTLFKLSGYVEVYYGYDFSRPINNLRPGFIYSHNKHNEVALNIGMIKASVTEERVRANFALMAGTYAIANLAHEPVGLRNIFEANIGLKLLKRKSLWLDMGVLPSHIGFESPIGMDCLNMTRSIIADNTPYYESGVNVNYTSDNGKWLLSGLILNGWQRMRRLEGQQWPSFGHQITWKPKPKLKLNSSSFVGYAAPDSLNKLRVYHNFFMEYRATKKLELLVGLDIGNETNSATRWGNFIWITSYQLNDKLRSSLRLERFTDHSQILISNDDFILFDCSGYSLNFDYQPSKQSMLRIEFRHLRNSLPYFQNINQSFDRSNFYLGSAICFKF